MHNEIMMGKCRQNLLQSGAISPGFISCPPEAPARRFYHAKHPALRKGGKVEFYMKQNKHPKCVSYTVGFNPTNTKVKT